MKLIVAGSRSIIDYKTVEKEIINYVERRDLWNVEIVCGMAKGVDILAYEFAARYAWKVHEFPADWDQFGKAAGIIRNKKMGDFADELLLIWDGKSKGSKHMSEYMSKMFKPVVVSIYEQSNPMNKHVFGLEDVPPPNLLGF